MPEPGSNAYDERFHRLRKHLVDEGFADDEADRLARASMAEEAHGAHPAAGTDRAAGPYGASGRGGESGHTIELRSPAFSDHAPMPARFTMTGQNVSPPLEWSGVPDQAAELAIVCEDPDAPNGTFTHWVVTAIPPSVTSVAEGTPPDSGRVWRNDFGDAGYDGPLPPVGDGAHRYFFRLIALPEPVQLPEGAPAAKVCKLLEDRACAMGTLVGTFER